MNTWLKLDERSLNEPQVKSKSGVRLEISLSPFDIPEAVRGFKEAGSGWFCVQFRYPDSEDGVTRTVSDTMTVEEGKESGRIQILRVNVEKLAVEKVELALKVKVNRELNEGLSRFFKARTSGFAARQHGLAKRILNEKGRDLLSSLATSPR